MRVLINMYYFVDDFCKELKNLVLNALKKCNRKLQISCT